MSFADNRNKIGKYIPAVVFLIFIYGIALWFLFSPKTDYSSSEKRYLQKFPDANVEKVLSGEFGSEFETFFADQFPQRNTWVGINAYTTLAEGNNGASGVYNCKNGCLINKPVSTENNLEKNIGAVADFAKSIDTTPTVKHVPSTGNIADDVDVYGRLEPGSNGIGTLTLKNFASDDSVSLYLRPTTEMEFEIASPTHHDSLIVDGHLVYYNQTQDFMESDEKPVVRIKIDDSYVYNEGDEFVLISYKGKSSLWGDPWDFNVKLPDTEKWAVEERTTETGKQFVLVAKSTSGVKSTESEKRVRNYTQSVKICVESAAGDVIRL